MWLYDSELGSIFKENGLAPGDVILIVMFSILAVSALEMLILGLGREE
jgi:hypothetical protein